MPATQNILDSLCEAALEYEFFPGQFRITKRFFKGSHGQSVTQDLMIEDKEGNTFRVTAELQPEESETLYTRTA